MYAKYTKFSHTYAINYSYSNYILKYSIEIVNIFSQIFVIFVKKYTIYSVYIFQFDKKPRMSYIKFVK